MKINVFLGGGVKLLHGENEFLKGYRNDVIDPIISQLNSEEYAKHVFITKDYSDLTRNVVKGDHQEVYNKYIKSASHIAIFIVDGKIGNITKQEMDIAIASTKRNHHPIVFVYGKNINEDDEILKYLAQESIYYQHFYDNRDLSGKIKTDLYFSIKKIERQKALCTWGSFSFTFILIASLLLLSRNYFLLEESPIESCSAQLYLMRYKDVNIQTGQTIFSDSLLSVFQYEDSIATETEHYHVFPIIKNDSIITPTPPFFRIKLHNKHRNTIVFVSAELEIDQYSTDSISYKKKFIPINIKNDNLNVINIERNKFTYQLKEFRQNVAYGETDDRYYYYLTAPENCFFRMRVKAKSQTGETLYSNFVYAKYIFSN